MTRRAKYSNDELAAFKLSDELEDMAQVPIEEVRRLLGALACAGERTRYMLERASYGLLESNRQKRVNLHEITKMEMAK